MSYSIVDALLDSVPEPAVHNSVYLSRDCYPQLTTIPPPSQLSGPSYSPFTPRTPLAIYAAKKKYKPVALKVRPVMTELPKRFRVVRKIIGDPLADMPVLPTNPTHFEPTGRYTLERKQYIDKVHDGDFLWPSERNLMHQFMMLHQDGFAWNDSQRGHFREDFFPPVEIPTVPHVPWAIKNIPIPPGIYNDVCAIIKKKIEIGVLEPSNASYRSRWFCVAKKDGTSLRMVQSLEPLNAVTIAHSGVTPFAEHLVEQFAGRACGGMLDLYVGYDERALAKSSRDYTHLTERTGQPPYQWDGQTQFPSSMTTSHIYSRKKFPTSPTLTSMMYQ